MTYTTKTGTGAGPSHTVFDKAVFGTFTGLLKRYCRFGNLTLLFLDFDPVTVGDGTGEAFRVRLNGSGAMLRMLYRPSLHVGEVFMDAGWELEKGDLGRFLGLLLRNEEYLEQAPLFRGTHWLTDRAGHLLNINTVKRSHRNVQHHYDIGNDLYEAFLDPDLLYSCAFFDDGISTLEEAQQNKLETTIRRARVEPGMHVLDIGCGWGAMVRALARHGAQASGVTLAERQLEIAKARIPEEHAGMIDLHLQDYRDHARDNPGRYDRIVSIGMFEHVGSRHYAEYFEAVDRLLKPGGRAVIHSIVKKTDAQTNPWIRKYIFPGGQIPRVEDMIHAAEGAGLTLPNPPHIHESRNYAETLRHWRRRFEAAWPRLDHGRYDDRFRRMWLFYLAGSEASFDALGSEVAQVVVEKPA